MGSCLEKELLFEGKEVTASVKIAEFTPQGVKLEITVAGKVAGKISGQILSTHYILMKPGGTGELVLNSIIFSSGEPILVTGKAIGKLVDPTPIGEITADLTFQTPSQKLSYLNIVKGWSESHIQHGIG